MKTEVVNLYKDPDFDVYIGRAGKGQDGYFGNPFSGPSKEANIKQFRTYFMDRIKTDREFYRRVLELRGKRLGCFCAPKPCHGDVIAQYLNDLPEPNPLKLAVVISESFEDYEYLCEILSWFEIKQILGTSNSLAKKYAEEKGIRYKEFAIDWDKNGKSAGFVRNKSIVDAADEVVVFLDGQSKDTQHTIEVAEEKGKPVHIYKPKSFGIDELATLG